jgi:hypothetical protein
VPRLRVIATIMMPVWRGIAARWDLGITDLQQVADRKLPVRVLGGTGEVFRAVLGYYGLTREKIESWGGKFLSSLATTPGHEYVVAPQVRSGDVDVILDNVYAAYTPEAASFVQASVLLDHGRHLFRQTHIPYSYDSVQVARDHGIPLHPGAERYYRERGYLA